MSKGEHKTAEYLKVHPHGSLPAITDSEKSVTMFESAAIVIYLAEKYNRFQPAPNTADRAHYLQYASLLHLYLSF